MCGQRSWSEQLGRVFHHVGRHGGQSAASAARAATGNVSPNSERGPQARSHSSRAAIGERFAGSSTIAPFRKRQRRHVQETTARFLTDPIPPARLLPMSLRPLASIFAAALVIAASPAPGCAVTKKLIESGWDEPTPAFMRKHLAQMEATPFDGVVYRVEYPKPDGSTGNFTWEAWGTRRVHARAAHARAPRPEGHALQEAQVQLPPLQHLARGSRLVRRSLGGREQRAARGLGGRGERLGRDLVRPRAVTPPSLRLRQAARREDAQLRRVRRAGPQPRRRGDERVPGGLSGAHGVLHARLFVSVAGERRRQARARQDANTACSPFLDGWSTPRAEDAARSTGTSCRTRSAIRRNSPRAIAKSTRCAADRREPEKYRQVFSCAFGRGWTTLTEEERLERDRHEAKLSLAGELRVRAQTALATTDEFVWLYRRDAALVSAKASR